MSSCCADCIGLACFLVSLPVMAMAFVSADTFASASLSCGTRRGEEGVGE